MSHSTDPYSQLHNALVRAAALAPAPRLGVWSRLRRWTRAHVVLSTLLAVAIVGGSTATAVVLQPVPSRAIRGVVPAGVSSVPERYRVFVSPQLEYGQVGWCTGLTFTRDGRRVGGAGACEPAPGLDDDRIVETQVQLTRGDEYRIVVTDDRIAALGSPRGRLVSPVPDPTVPNGWRLAAFAPGSSGSESAGGISAATPDVGASFDTNIVAYDRHGHVVPNAYRDLWNSSWMSNAGRQRAPAGICRVTLSGMGKQTWDELSLRQRPVSDATRKIVPTKGPGLLACATVQVHGALDQRGAVHVLVDADHPGRVRPMGIAGARLLPGSSDIYAFSAIGSGGAEHPMAAEIAYARRTDNAWIVVEADNPVARRSLISRATLLP